ncbi:MAG: membrane protein insertase YidC [Bacteroidetes bacterium]|nr:membrane protein insertase YidC [Bacteroidota bacterium]
MDKNSIVGIVLIFLVLIGYSYLTKPTEEERQVAIRKQDSIALVTRQNVIEETKIKEETKNALPVIQPQEVSESTKNTNQINQYGSFAKVSQGENQFVTLENNLIKVKFSSKGGRVYSVQLKNYETYDSLPVTLFDGDSTIFGLNFFAQNRSIATNELFFTPGTTQNQIVIDSSKSVSLKLKLADNQFIEYSYTLEANTYMLKFDINFVGMNNIIANNLNYLTLNWEANIPRQEKGKKWESDNTTVFYKYLNDEVDELSIRSKDAKEELQTKVKWVAFKQQFFSSFLIADNSFINGFVKVKKIENSDKYLKKCYAELTIPYKNKASENIPMKFYFGPNKYKTLHQYKLKLEDVIPLGWGIFSWVNKFAIIPLFNLLSKFISNYGIIILVMTIIIKLVLFPFTRKSYLSSAKMRVLKPQIDELGKKFPKKEDAMKKQQATMALYKKVGVNPMGGCLPMVFQMPILIAIFRFFPSSIELRHQGFLWATDLSTYDSILSLPFTIPYYGDHVSLFCLLMTIVNLFYIKINNEQTNMSSQQMPGMKVMMYFMPVMMLFWFNDYASGLSYYYFLSLLITILQTVFIKKTIDEKALLEKLNSNVKKPAKKSKFQQKLEQAAKQKGYSQKHR